MKNKIFCTGPLRAAKAGQKSLVPAPRTNQLADCLYNCVLHSSFPVQSTQCVLCTGKLLEFIGLTAEFQSGIDLVYLADCLYNCVLCTGKLLEFTGLTAEFKSGLDLVYLAGLSV
jgi:hypothetical protein